MEMYREEESVREKGQGNVKKYGMGKGGRAQGKF